ncbi:MAG: glycosyltransferase family 4 protein [Cyanobacteria bacterium P01_F01_bin.150]
MEIANQKVLVLSEIFFPEVTSTGYFLTKIAEGLSNSYAVKVLAGPIANESQITDVLDEDKIRQIEIHRCNGTEFDKNWLPGRILNGITRSFAIFYESLKLCDRGDIIFVVTNPPLLPFFALLLSWLKGAKLVLLVHDVYPEALIASGLIKKNSLPSKIIQLANKFLCRKADRLVTIGRDMSKVLSEKVSNQEKLCCIPNWADLELVHPASKQDNPVLQKLDMTENFVVLHAGNMGRTHDIELLAHAAVTLEKENSNVRFVFVGSGAKKEWLAEFIAENKLSNVHLLPFLPHSEKNISLNACDVAIISYLPDMAGISVPSRMYNHLASGKPIIAVADAWSELAQVVLEDNVGWNSHPGDLESLVDIIRQAAQNPEQCQQMGDKAAAIAREKYTLEHSDRAYSKLFESLCSAETALASKARRPKRG